MLDNNEASSFEAVLACPRPFFRMVRCAHRAASCPILCGSMYITLNVSVQSGPAVLICLSRSHLLPSNRVSMIVGIETSDKDSLDGTAELGSRDQMLNRERGQGNINFPYSEDHE